ncbi:efflux RND transporter periplasmic adaptor subunit, partial [Ralstonia sp.]|uniref:efflux RND transporter periplasmic adaptor subunit n=1 Tax=Ralstonia sp. TaxID=54061 RepID=UPI001A5C3FE9
FGAETAGVPAKLRQLSDAAKAQLSAAQAQADVARNASRYAELVADGDGVVMETLAEPGQVVNAAQAVVRLAHAGRREAVVQLPETLRPAIGSVAQATLFGAETAGVPAKLRQLSDAADRLTRTFEARYVLDGDLANAPLGSTVTIQIADRPATAQGDVQVPLGAVFDAGKGPGVWLIQGEPAKVSWRSVTIARVGDEGAHVGGQVKPGDRIVALGAQLLREGQQVRVAGQDAGTAIAGVRL